MRHEYLGKQLNKWALHMVLCLLVGGCNGSCDPAASPHPATMQREMKNSFLGRVVDQDGKPIAGATIAVRSMRYGGTDFGNSPVPDRQNAFEWEVFTDAKGQFGVGTPDGYQVLEIVDVRKEGYIWVYDWFGNGPHRGPIKQSNRYFVFRGPARVEREYLVEYGAPAGRTESHNPAIYPMLADGAQPPADGWTASRGGADRDPSGNVTVNGPVRILLPSAGPGSPGTDPRAIGEAIAAFPREEVERWMKEHGVDNK